MENEQGSGRKSSSDGKIDDVGEGKSFATEEEAFTEIDRIIKTGKKGFENGDKNIPPEQEALLRGLDYREYPTIQELSATKIGNNSDIAKENGELETAIRELSLRHNREVYPEQPSDNISEQEALLRGHNYREYPTIQELSVTKIGNNSDLAKESGENIVEDTAKYRCLP